MFTFIYNTITRSVVVLLVAMLSVNYLPENLFHNLNFEPRSMEPNDYDSVIPKPWNTKLSDAPEYIQLNNILGPESIAIGPNGLLYTGLADGRLVELDPSKNYKLREVCQSEAKSDQCPPNVATNADLCGRYLQVRFQNGSIFAIDSNKGLYRVNPLKGDKTFLGPRRYLDRVNLFNSFVYDPKEPNLVYITVSSTRRTLLSIVWSIMELENSGKIIALDTQTNKQVVLIDKLFMPNGIDVDVKRDKFVFTETLKGRVNSFPLAEARAAFKKANDGDRLGLQAKQFIPVTPGNPDNIVIQGDMAYIALPFVKLNGKDLNDNLSNLPNVRKAIVRFIFAMGSLMEQANKIYGHPLIEAAYRELKCGHVIYRLMQTDKSAVLEYNIATGTSRLLGSDKFGFVSEAIPDGKGNLLLGSFRSPFMVKVKI